MRRPVVGVVLTLALGLAACGSATPGERAVSGTEERLDDVRSGHLSMRLLASTADAARGQGIGFEVEGMFAVSKEVGSLPVADLEYTRITGSTRRSTRFLSTGRRAFAEAEGNILALGDDDVKDMRVRGGKGTGEGGLDGLDLTTWFLDPKVTNGTPVDGIATERVTGPIDPVAALNDLLTLSVRFGAAEPESPRTLSGASAERVRESVSRASGELLTGTTDRLLRHLHVDIDIKPQADQEKLRAALGDLTGARLQFTLDVSKLNTPVEVLDPR